MNTTNNNNNNNFNSGSDSVPDYGKINDKIMEDWIISMNEENEKDELEAEADWILYLEEIAEISERASWQDFVNQSTEAELVELYKNCKRYLLSNDTEKWNALDMVLFEELVQEYEENHPISVDSPTLRFEHVKDDKSIVVYEIDEDDVADDVVEIVYDDDELEYKILKHEQWLASQVQGDVKHHEVQPVKGKWWIYATKTV